jgi:signal transduction histidine kinase
VTFLVIRAMGVFEAERNQQLERLAVEREDAHQATLLAQSEARRAAEDWTDALVNINRGVANIEAVDAVLPTIVQAAGRLLAADAAGLALWAEGGAFLEVKCWALTGAVPVVGSQPVSDPVLLQVARQGRPLRLPEIAEGGWHCPALKQVVPAACWVPLMLNGHSLGCLWVARAADERFSLADVTGLEHLADQAVIALEHALMAARLQSLAVVEERGRIAREMHDGLSQVLGYLSLQMQTLEALVRQGKCDVALAELSQARGHIREGILSLRTTLSGQAALVPALRQYVDEFGVQTGVQAEVDTDFAGEPCLSPLAEAQLMRIAQEALTNVRKHAQAQHVRLRLNLTHDLLRVTIADDGRGFSVPAVGQGHYGLQTMRERAESVGGGLTVTSGVGGTQLEAWLPRVLA